MNCLANQAGSALTPRTAARLAPVMAGALPGCWRQCHQASNAKARPSRASALRPSSSLLRSRMPRQRCLSSFISTGFRLPPPATMSSRGRTSFLMRRLSRSCATTAALKAVNVATRLAVDSVGSSFRRCSRSASPNCSRPVDLGGGSWKKASFSQLSIVVVF